MGGHAFSLQYPCPRLASSLYSEVTARLLTQLRDLFTYAVVSPSAPEKTSFGDVDAIVCLPREADLASVAPDLHKMRDRFMEHMGAVAARVSHGVLFLCVPLPEGLLKKEIENDSEELLSSCASAVSESEKSESDNEREEVKKEEMRALDDTTTLSAPAFVQLDLQLCDAESQLPWSVFTIAYGDLYGILKTGLRRSGLSLRPSGLFVHMPPLPEEEKEGPQAVTPTAAEGHLLFLSNDVNAVLAFLGLDATKYHNGFATMDELFGYAAGAKFFNAETFADIIAGSSSSAELVDEDDNDGGDSVRDTKKRASTSLTTFAAYELKKRPTWVCFAREWLPQHHSSIDSPTTHGPPNALEPALVFFGATARHHAQEEATRAVLLEARFWTYLKPLIPSLDNKPMSKPRITNIIQALRRYTVFDGTRGGATRPVLSSTPQLDEERQPRWTGYPGGFTRKDLLDWVRGSWAAAYELDRARTREKRHAKRDEAEKRKEERKGRGVSAWKVLFGEEEVEGWVFGIGA